MLGSLLKQTTERAPRLAEGGLVIARAIHKAVLQGGQPTRTLADVLHGTWLGHPLHPVLTDLTIGAWVFGGVFDAVAASSGSWEAERIADALTEAGTMAAVPTLLTGLTDYSTVQKPAVPTATLHALVNAVNLVLYLLSVRDRKQGHRRRAVRLSTSALTLSMVAAWLGGHLVYRHKVGVDHSESRQGPASWTPALAANDLPDQTPRRVEVDGSTLLLYRCNGALHAIGAVCSHAGGPLEEGRFEDCTVQCPWHDSVFDLRSGRIVHGPATNPQPAFDVRERDGQIEVRLAAHGET